MELKQLFLDVETTGLDPAGCGIHQIAGSIRIDEKEVERFNWKVRPHPSAVIDDLALTKCRITYEDMVQYPMYPLVWKKLMEVLDRHKNILRKRDKYQIVGYNCQAFDGPFIRRFMDKYSPLVNYYGDYCYNATCDVMVIAAERLKRERHKIESFSLSSVAKHLGIAVDESRLHDADYDIRLTEALYDALTKR